MYYLQVKSGDNTFDWGMIINFKKKSVSKNPATKENMTVIVDILLHVAKNSSQVAPIPCPAGEEGEIEIIPTLHNLITHISSLRLYYPKDLRPLDNRKSVLKSIEEVKKRFEGDSLPLLDPITDMKIEDPIFKNLIKKLQVLEERLENHPFHKVSSRYYYFNTSTMFD